eukprot:2714677-Amphidinium_carterae.1
MAQDSRWLRHPCIVEYVASQAKLAREQQLNAMQQLRHDCGQQMSGEVLKAFRNKHGTPIPSPRVPGITRFLKTFVQ